MNSNTEFDIVPRMEKAKKIDEKSLGNSNVPIPPHASSVHTMLIIPLSPHPQEPSLTSRNARLHILRSLPDSYSSPTIVDREW